VPEPQNARSFTPSHVGEFRSDDSGAVSFEEMVVSAGSFDVVCCLEVGVAVNVVAATSTVLVLESIVVDLIVVVIGVILQVLHSTGHDAW
jgi:hypothetical protein